MENDPLEPEQFDLPADDISSGDAAASESDSSFDTSEQAVNDQQEIMSRDQMMAELENLSEFGSEQSIQEYNSAVSYISDLISQLRGGPSGTSMDSEGAVDPEQGNRATQVSGEGDGPTTTTLSQTMPLEELKRSGGKDQRKSPNPGPVDLGKASMNADAPDAIEAVIDDADGDYSTENGRAYGRSMLHNLREAAHLATSTSLDLNDCATYAHRAYYASFFGCACALFSTIFVLMSPRTGTFGFAASVGALAIALVLGLTYVLCFRALVTKTALVRKARADSVDSTMPIS